MIKENPDKELPVIWDDENIVELWEHSRYLGQNGNPSGFFVTVGMFPFVGYEDDTGRHLNPPSEWNYSALRDWIGDNQELVSVTWRREVVNVY